MRSATSCFNLTLYQKNLSRFWPIWALYGLIWLFLLPISILNESRWWDSARAAQRPLQFLEGGSAGLAMALIFGLLSAMAVFSYLYNSRSVGLMHTLPLKREGLFLTNYLSGLSCFLLPNLAVFVLSLAAEALAGAVNAGSLCMWLTVQSLLCFFFYSFAVFCAMFTGHILALPAFYGILNILAAGLAYLFDALAGAFVYGYAGIPRLSEAAVWLSPALRLTYTLNLIYPGGNGVYVQFYGLHVVLLYALAGLILTGLALLVYRRRSLERAGDIVSVGWVSLQSARERLDPAVVPPSVRRGGLFRGRNAAAQAVLGLPAELEGLSGPAGLPDRAGLCAGIRPDRLRAPGARLGPGGLGPDRRRALRPLRRPQLYLFESERPGRSGAGGAAAPGHCGGKGPV